MIERSWAGKHCIAALEHVPFEKMPGLYSSADVLIKLSTAEGMFGPPLEMFACGGTAIVWDVWGSEEYITHRYNALVAPMHSLAAAAACARELMHAPALLAELKANARKTAERWPNWDDMTPQILAAVDALPPIDPARLRHNAAEYLHQRKPLPGQGWLSAPIEQFKVMGNSFVRSMPVVDETVRPVYRRLKRAVKKVIRRQ